MSNTLLTPTQVTRKALMVLHQKLNFVGSINREYDPSFAKDGAKIGDTLKIRLPNKYVVRTGAALVPNETSESSVSLQVATQKGVDLSFTSTDLTLSLDEFNDRILEPAMAVLAASIESDAMNMYKDIWQQVDNHGQASTFAKVLAGRKMLVDSLVPLTNRTANLNTQDNVDMVDNLKGLFNDSSSLNKQYLEGYMGRTAGFDFMENTLWPQHPRGAANTAYVLNGDMTEGASTVVVQTGSGALAVGDVFTIASVYRVHPESKVSTGVLHKFVVTTAYTGGAGTISFSPPMYASGALQNVNALGLGNAVVTVDGAASTSHGISMLHHKDAFAFATADLVMPKGVDFAAREVYDGISIRIVRQYCINDDTFPCRLDVLYGYKTLRGSQAVRLANN